jgi:hypothetical protein
MLGRLARAAYLLTLAVMIVAYALSAGKNSPPEPQIDEPVVIWYS